MSQPPSSCQYTAPVWVLLYTALRGGQRLHFDAALLSDWQW